MKILDYYYLVVLRGYDTIAKKDRLSYHVSGIMSFTLTVNIFSFFILFSRHVFFQYGIWLFVSYFIVMTLLMYVLDAIYNKRRREKLREEYEVESLESRRRGAAWVWTYEILSMVLFIWVLSTIEKPV